MTTKGNSNDPPGSATIAGASLIQSGDRVSGNTTTDAGATENLLDGDQVPYNWHEAEYWTVSITAGDVLTISYRATTAPYTPIMQLMAPGTNGANVSSANGLDFNGIADGTNERGTGNYSWTLSTSGTYVLAIGVGNEHGINGGYEFSVSITHE
ncbi:MAG: hypothetical protein WCF24_04835 [Acidimicrobiales bacterium]